MKAVVFESFGPPSILKVTTQPKPQKKRGELMVELTSTSVNPVDWKTRKGEVPTFLVKLPKVPGGDVAGTIIGEGSARFPPGTRVFACTDGFQLYNKEGSYAEYSAVPERYLAKVPKNISLEDAGGLPLVCLTAWQALEAAGLQPGKRILIHAGAGGVGSIAIQLAKARGLHVTTTCSDRNIQLCKDLGADQVIDYKKMKFEAVFRDTPFDAIIDLIGGSVEVRSMRVLKHSGVFVSVLNSGFIHEKGFALGSALVLYHLLAGKIFGMLRIGPKYKSVIVKPCGEQLAKVAELLESGKVRPVVDRRLPLEQAAEAHAYLEQGHASGKVILVIKAEKETQ